MRKNDQKDYVLNLLDTIKEQNKTIDKLSDKLISVTSPEAVHVYKNDADPTPMKDENPGLIDPDQVTAEQAFNDTDRAD